MVHYYSLNLTYRSYCTPLCSCWKRSQLHLEALCCTLCCVPALSRTELKLFLQLAPRLSHPVRGRFPAAARLPGARSKSESESSKSITSARWPGRACPCCCCACCCHCAGCHPEGPGPPDRATSCCWPWCRCACAWRGDRAGRTAAPPPRSGRRGGSTTRCLPCRQRAPGSSRQQVHHPCRATAGPGL